MEKTTDEDSLESAENGKQPKESCPYCGQHILATDHSCVHCGDSLKSPTDGSKAAKEPLLIPMMNNSSEIGNDPSGQNPDSHSDTPDSNNNAFSTVGIVLMVLGCLALCGVTWAILFNFNATPSASPTSTPMASPTATPVPIPELLHLSKSDFISQCDSLAKSGARVSMDGVLKVGAYATLCSSESCGLYLSENVEDFDSLAVEMPIGKGPNSMDQLSDPYTPDSLTVRSNDGRTVKNLDQVRLTGVAYYSTFPTAKGQGELCKLIVQIVELLVSANQ